MTRSLISAVCLLVVGLATADERALTKAQKAELGQHFGFGPMQIYKLKPGISQLELADLNGDGRTDIALWNARQSRIELFYQRDPDAPPEDAADELERNEIPNRGNMRHENVPIAYSLKAMKIADLTGDKRPDIVFFGEPKELVILPALENGGFGPPSARRAPDGAPRGGALCVGDFNHDGRTDAALLGPDVLMIFHQKPAGGLAKPLRIIHGVKQPGLMLRADLNGDGRDDLVILADDPQYGAYVCLQDTAGTLSALRRIKVPDLRSLTIVPAAGGDDVFSIESATGHLKHYRWQIQPETGGTADWPQRLYSYPLKIKAKRLPLAVGDLTGDGLPDCVAADPEAAQLVLFRGTAQGLSAGTAFPGLMKTAGLLIADLDGDGRNELLSVSAEEKTLGVSTYTDGRVTFPKPLPIQGIPLAVAVGNLKTADRGTTCLAYLSRPQAAKEGDEDEEEEEENGKLRLRLVDPATHDEIQSWDCDEVDDPNGLRLADVNQDGRNDILLFARFSSPQTYLQNEDGTFKPLKGPQTREGLIKAAKIGRFRLSDVTGDGKPEILVAQKGLARALVVQDGRWTVVDQYNPDTADAEITGLAALPGEPGSPTLVMYDRKARDLLVLRRREDGTYTVAQSMPVGNLDLSAMTGLSIGKDERPGLLMADAKKLILLTPSEVAPTLVAQRSYESDVKDAWLADAVVGDLNHDGVRDLAVVDMRKASVEILTTLPGGGYVRAMRFQVFQGKRFSEEPDSYGEPREVLIGDVTGDKIDDIILLVHDRLIVYPGQ